MTQQTLISTITRNVSNCWVEYEEEFHKAKVSSFDEAIEMCKAVGSFHGMIEQCVEFIEIDTTNMTAEFKVNGRMRYEGDTFTLSVTTKNNNMAQQKPNKIEVEIEYIDHLFDSEGNHISVEPYYLASINKYKMIVKADSIANCFKELSTSKFVADTYEKLKQK